MVSQRDRDDVDFLAQLRIVGCVGKLEFEQPRRPGRQRTFRRIRNAEISLIEFESYAANQIDDFNLSLAILDGIVDELFAEALHLGNEAGRNIADQYDLSHRL